MPPRRYLLREHDGYRALLIDPLLEVVLSPRRNFWVSLGLFWVASQAPLQADVYKFVGRNGQVVYTDNPNGSGYKLVIRSKKSPSQVLERGMRREIQGPPGSPRLIVLGNGGNYRPFVTSLSPSRLDIPAQLRKLQFDDLVNRAAQTHGLDPSLLHAVIRAESAYNPEAVSSKGAVGLMQLMPGTAARYGVRNPYNPEDNVFGGARYLRDLLGMFRSDVRLAVAAYNAGEGNVMKFGNQVPPFAETQGYVSKVLSFWGRLN